MKVTLTFDNGPDQQVTPHVLDVLEKHQVLTTFFVLGHKVVKPELLALAKLAHSKGHWIGNHTWTHEIPLGKLGNVERSVTEISDTQAEITNLAHPNKFFRPFGGGGILGPHLLSENSRDYLQQGGFTVVLWNAIPGDWKDPKGWADTALEQIQQQDWSVVVVHDMPTDGAMDLLEDFILRAKALGAKFVQEFPDSVLPMQSGVAQPLLTECVANT